MTGNRVTDTARALADLRDAGWAVAVHNDYRQDGQLKTFWLFTHPNGTWVKGEGLSDAEAIALAHEAAFAAAKTSEDEVERISEKIESNLIEQYKANPTWEDAKDVIENIDCVALAKAAALSPRPQAGMISADRACAAIECAIEAFHASEKMTLKEAIDEAISTIRKEECPQAEGEDKQARIDDLELADRRAADLEGKLAVGRWELLRKRADEDRARALVAAADAKGAQT
jgi:hypothetical protein